MEQSNLGGESMKISETMHSKHEMVCIRYNGIDGKTHEKWVGIHKDSDGDVLDVSIGNKEISAFDLQVLDFLKKEGKL